MTLDQLYRSSQAARWTSARPQFILIEMGARSAPTFPQHIQVSRGRGVPKHSLNSLMGRTGSALLWLYSCRFLADVDETSTLPSIYWLQAGDFACDSPAKGLHWKECLLCLSSQGGLMSVWIGAYQWRLREVLYITGTFCVCEWQKSREMLHVLHPGVSFWSSLWKGTGDLEFHNKEGITLQYGA